MRDVTGQFIKFSKFSSTVMTNGAAVLALVLVSSAPIVSSANAQAEVWGSYLKTCKNISHSKKELTASCDNGNGYYKVSHLAYVRCSKGADIYNDFGQLGCTAPMDQAQGTAIPGGSYRASCAQSYVNGKMLTAACKIPSGAYVNASLNLSHCNPKGDIANINGHLECKAK